MTTRNRNSLENLIVFLLVFGTGLGFAFLFVVQSTNGPIDPVGHKKETVSQYADLPEDDPLWDCRTEGNADCGGNVATLSCVIYEEGTGVCVSEDGKRTPIRVRTDSPYK